MKPHNKNPQTTRSNKTQNPQAESLIQRAYILQLQEEISYLVELLTEDQLTQYKEYLESQKESKEVYITDLHYKE